MLGKDGTGAMISVCRTQNWKDKFKERKQEEDWKMKSSIFQKFLKS